MIARAKYLVLLWLAIAGVLRAEIPDQTTRWKSAQIRPEALMRLNKATWVYSRMASRYDRVERMRSPGAPALVIFCLHLRESGADFACHPHEGSPLTHRTRDIPKGRIPAPAKPPFTWEQSAEDAYYVCDRLDLPDWKNCAATLQAMESFNGTGYQRFHPGVPSPYLWSATTIYRRGKYVRDGRFDPLAVDAQLGCAAVLKRMEELGMRLPFNKENTH